MNDPGHAHELTWTCYQGRHFFRAERCCQWFIRALRDARVELRFQLWAYVIMPNHVHVLLWAPQDNAEIEYIGGSIKQRTSRRAMNYLRTHNPAGLRYVASNEKARPYMFWQDGGGYDRNMMSPKALHASLDYIHNNPVRKELVLRPEDWIWSSIHEWEKPGSGMIPIDRESFPTLTT